MNTVVALLLAAFLTQTTPAADSVQWDYDDADVVAGAVALFLVCVDGQPTANCVQVPVTSGVPQTATPTTKTFTWSLPALTPGKHTIAVQACSAIAANCSSGVSIVVQVNVVIVNPKNLRLVKR